MSKEKIIESAEKYSKSGKIDRAIKEYQKLAAEDPADMRARMKIADLHAKKKDVPTAVKLYSEVAEFYDKENFHLKAIAVYKTILKYVPTMVEINEKLGNLYHRVGLDQDAVKQYYIVASNYEGKGDGNPALLVRRKIVDIIPSSAAARIRLAELLQAEGKMDESLREYERAAEILEASKDYEGLPEVYEKMLHFKPSQMEILVNLARLYLEKKDFKKILRRIEAIPAKIKKSPPNAKILEIWSEALLGDRQAEASRRKFKETYSLAIETKDTESAARLYNRMLQEFGDDPDYLNEVKEIGKD